MALLEFFSGFANIFCKATITFEDVQIGNMAWSNKLPAYRAWGLHVPPDVLWS